MPETVGLIGHTGFVGTHLDLNFTFTHRFNSKNIASISGLVFDRLIIAAPSAQKWATNNDPSEYFKSLIRLIYHLSSCTVLRRVILVSTIDVYGKKQLLNPVHEDEYPTPDCAYGEHHLMLEMACRSLFGSRDILTIVRLPALYGLGLKKNAFYDLLHDNKVSAVYKNSKFKAVDVCSAAEFILSKMMSVPEDYDIINYFPSDVTELGVIQEVFPRVSSTSASSPAIYMARSIRDDCVMAPSKANFTNWIYREWLLGTLMLSQLSIPERIIPGDMDRICSALGIGAFELVPCMWHPWDSPLEVWDAPHFQKMTHMQSISYGVDASICSMRFIEHYAKVIQIIDRIGTIKTLTLGSPRSRYEEDTMDEVVRFLTIMVSMTPPGVRLCLEGNPKEYAAGWGNTSSSIYEILERVPGLWLTLDTGCWEMMHPEQDLVDVVEQYQFVLGHVHISLPRLEPIVVDSAFDSAKIERFARRLSEVNYDGKISIEQRNVSLHDPRLVQSIDMVAKSLRPLYTHRLGHSVDELVDSTKEQTPEDGFGGRIVWSRPLSQEENKSEYKSRLVATTRPDAVYLETEFEGQPSVILPCRT